MLRQTILRALRRSCKKAIAKNRDLSRSVFRRTLQVESLESRRLLAADYEVSYGPEHIGGASFGTTAVVGTDIYYWDVKPETGAELHKLDTLTQTSELVLDINPGVASSNIIDTDTAGFALIGSDLYFLAYEPVSGVKLRRLDLSQQTPTLETFDGETPPILLSRFVVVGEKFYFWGNQEVRPWEYESRLYWFDSTESSPQLRSMELFDSDTGAPLKIANDPMTDQRFATYKEKLFFWAADSNSELSVRWIDTNLVTPAVKTIAVTGHINNVAPARILQLAGNKLFFSDVDLTYGYELRWIDASESSPTIHTLDIYPGERGSNAAEDGYAIADNKLFFTATDDLHGKELRRIDLDRETIDVELIEFTPGTESTIDESKYGLIAAGNKVYFGLKWLNNRYLIGWIDATLDSPALNSVNTTFAPNEATAVGNWIFTPDQNLRWIDTINDPSVLHNTELWFPLGNEAFPPLRYTYVGDKVYFLAIKAYRFSLWYIDTTAASPDIHELDIFTFGHMPKNGSYTSFDPYAFSVSDKLYTIGLGTDGRARLTWIDNDKVSEGFKTLNQVDIKRGLGVVNEKILFVGTAENQQPRLYWIDSTLDVPVAHDSGAWPDDIPKYSSDHRPPIAVGSILFIDTSSLDRFSMIWIDASQDVATINKLQIPTPGDLASKLFVAGSRIFFTYETVQGNCELQMIEILDGRPMIRTLSTILTRGVDRDYNKSYSLLALVDNKLYVATNYSFGNRRVQLRWLDTNLESPILHDDIFNSSTTKFEQLSFKGSSDGRLFFTSDDNQYGNQLRWIDTRRSPSVLNEVDITLSDSQEAYIYGDISLIDGKAYFMIADRNSNEYDLCWIDFESDPASVFWLNSSQRVLYVHPGLAVATNHRFYFEGDRGYGPELIWIETNTNNPDIRSIDLDPDADARVNRWSGEIYHLFDTPFDNRLYFISTDLRAGTELRWIDLLMNDPVLHTIDVFAGPDSSIPSEAYHMNGKLHLRARLNKYTAAFVTVETTAAPNDISLSQSTFNEDVLIGTELSTLTSQDLDFGETFTYSLVTGDGDADNELFSIVDDKLVLKAALDFRTKTALNIRIRTTDSTNRSLEKTFTINVTDVAEAPVAIPDAYVVPINFFRDFSDAWGDQTVDIKDNGVLANDSDGDGDALTAELVTSTLNGTLTFHSDGTFRYRANAFASIGMVERFTYRVTDATGLSSESTVTLTISDPVDSPLHNKSAPLDVSPGTSSGVISSLDVLAIINLLNANRGRGSISVEELIPSTYFYDVNNDFFVSSLDALAIINYLNARSRGLVAEGLADNDLTSSATQGHRQLEPVLHDAAMIDFEDLTKKRKA